MSKNKMTRQEATQAILAFLAEQDAEGAQTVHMSALITDDETTTLRDCIVRAVGLGVR